MSVSCCGKNCDTCTEKNEVGCGGCRETREGYWGGKCEIKECCTEKKLEHCGLCRDFPCAMLRSFSFDRTDGDNGDMLLNCKKWSDKRKNDRESIIKKYLIGGSVGISSGVIIGELQGSFLPWLVCGSVLGIGIAAIISVGRKNN